MITGAGAGIGVAIAKRYVAEGAKVCITGRRQHKLDEVVASLPPGTGLAFAGDVSKLDEAKRMVDATVAFGRHRVLDQVTWRLSPGARLGTLHVLSPAWPTTGYDEGLSYRSMLKLFDTGTTP